MTIGLPAGTYQLLTYEYVPDVLERRDPYRQAHLAHAAQARQRGDLVAVGAVGSPPTGALLVFADVAPAVVEAYAQADPYLHAGLVTGHHVAPWTVVA
jgi:uncharacterized protein YciI